MRRYTLAAFLAMVLVAPFLAGCTHTTEDKKNPITGSETKTETVN